MKYANNSCFLRKYILSTFPQNLGITSLKQEEVSAFGGGYLQSSSLYRMFCEPCAKLQQVVPF